MTLHSYRYGWAERGLELGYPERYAQAALGHKSRAVHQAYAKKGEAVYPSLESYEEKIVAFQTEHRSTGEIPKQPLKIDFSDGRKGAERR